MPLKNMLINGAMIKLFQYNNLSDYAGQDHYAIIDHANKKYDKSWGADKIYQECDMTVIEENA